MCGATNCPLRFREILNLRMLVNDLTSESGIDLLKSPFSPGYVLYDVCTMIGLEPREILPADVVNRILARELERPWPTLTEAEADELAETDAIREGVHSEWYNSTSEAERVALFARE